MACALARSGPARICKVSTSKARARIGRELEQDVVLEICQTLAQEQTHPDAFDCGLRLLAIDSRARSRHSQPICNRCPANRPRPRPFLLRWAWWPQITAHKFGAVPQRHHGSPMVDL